LSFNTKISDDAIELKKLGIFMQNLKQKLDAINLNPIICDPKDLIDLVKELLELELNSTIKKENIYNPNIILSEQILSPLFKHKILDDRIEHISSKLTSKAYFPIEMPKEFSLAKCSKIIRRWC
jgi:hypothetical protein